MGTFFDNPCKDEIEQTMKLIKDYWDVNRQLEEWIDPNKTEPITSITVQNSGSGYQLLDEFVVTFEYEHWPTYKPSI